MLAVNYFIQGQNTSDKNSSLNYLFSPRVLSKHIQQQTCTLLTCISQLQERTLSLTMFCINLMKASHKIDHFSPSQIWIMLA